MAACISWSCPSKIYALHAAKMASPPVSMTIHQSGFWYHFTGLVSSVVSSGLRLPESEGRAPFCRLEVDSAFEGDGLEGVWAWPCRWRFFLWDTLMAPDSVTP